MKERIIAGLDIGTSKIVCLIAKSTFPSVEYNYEDLKNSIPKTELIGTGIVYNHHCVSNGVIVDLEEAVSCIQRAMNEAQASAGVKLKEICVAIGTGLITGETSKGIVTPASPSQISAQDVANAIEQAKTIKTVPGTQTVYTMPQGFLIDDYSLKISNPIGMSGNRLAANVFIVRASNITVHNITSALKQIGCKVNCIIPQSVASSYAVIDSDEQKLGCIVIDIGEGGTDACVFYDGNIKSLFFLELGSEFITNDISIGLRLPKGIAEAVKTQYGIACSELTPDETIKLSNNSTDSFSNTGNNLKISRKFLASIIGSRIEEILVSIHRQIKHTEYSEFLSSGVVLTGGTAKIKGIDRLTERIFGLPARIGSPNTISMPENINGTHSILKDPRFASSIGLLIFASKPKMKGTAFQTSKHSMGVSLKSSKTIKLTSKLKSWFLD